MSPLCWRRRSPQRNKEHAMKAVIIDTSVLIHEPTSFLEFVSDYKVLIPIYVIMELDVLKDKKTHVSPLARKSSQLILEETNKTNSNVQIVSHTEELDLHALDMATEIRYVDLLILKTAEKYNREYELTLLTRDTNLRIMAESVGVHSEDYNSTRASEKVLEHTLVNIEPPEPLKSKLLKSYWEGAVRLTEEEVDLLNLENNQYVTIGSNGKEHLFHYREYTLFVVNKKDIRTDKVKPRNLEQTIALDLLLNDEITLVALLGKAGTGKTFLTLASALSQFARYQRILLSKPVVDVGKGIGFLPGGVGDKLEPWMQSFFDNLDQINPYWDVGNTLEERDNYFEKNHIEIQPINSIRGRSLKGAFMIIDEAQNLTKHEIKSIITRAAEGTKVVLFGDPYQIDNPYLDSKSNGLVYVIEKMRGQAIFGYTSLHKSERSELSDIAADLL